MEEFNKGHSAHEVKPVLPDRDGKFYNPEIERNSRSLVDIDLDHAMIHRGRHYYMADYLELGNAESADLFFQIGEKDIHFVYGVWSDLGPFLLTSYEDITITGGGTPMVIQNSNRNPEAPKTDTILLLNPTGVVIPEGNLPLRRTRLGGTTAGPGRVGGSVSRTAEVVLYRGKKYLIRLANLSGATNYINLIFAYYPSNTEM